MWGGVNEGLRLATRLVECVTKSWRYASSIGCEGGGAEENRKSERGAIAGIKAGGGRHWGARARVRQRASASSTPRTGRLALVARAALRLRRGEVGHPLPRAGRLAPGVWRREVCVVGPPARKHPPSAQPVNVRRAAWQNSCHGERVLVHGEACIPQNGAAVLLLSVWDVPVDVHNMKWTCVSHRRGASLQRQLFEPRDRVRATSELSCRRI